MEEDASEPSHPVMLCDALSESAIEYRELLKFVLLFLSLRVLDISEVFLLFNDFFCCNYSGNILSIWYFDDKVKDSLPLWQVMAPKKLIAICQSGGKFGTTKDGNLSYKGGDAHAIDIDDQMELREFKVEVADMFNINAGSMSIKYFLPGNKKTLITVSNDKDLQRMIKFHPDSSTVEIYIFVEEAAAPKVSNIRASR